MDAPSQPARDRMALLMQARQRAEGGESKNRARPSRVTAGPGLFLALSLAIAAAEAVTAFVGTVPGAALQAILALLLLNLGGMREQGRQGRAFVALALVPLMRVLSLTMPVPQLPEYWSYGFVSAPLLVGVFIAARLLGFTREDLGLRLTPPLAQVVLALSGVAFGAAAAWVARPDPLVPTLATGDLVFAYVMLILAGFAEEALFRGLLFSLARNVLGRRAPFFAAALLTSVLSAAMYLSSQSLPYILLMAVVALVFALAAGRTRSILGIGVAHCLLNVSALLIWPLFLR